MKRFALFLMAVSALAQSGKSLAPWDLTGYWVSIVTEDWRYRMQTAPKYDYYGFVLKAEAKKVADAWDAEKGPQGEACINFHAPVVMRQPGRLQVSWQNDNILKIETDAGKQTRLFYFSTPPVTNDTSMQGVSMASWQTPAAIRNVTNKLSAQNPITPGFPGINTQNEQPAPPPQKYGALRVSTTRVRAGQLRSNGIPFSAGAALTEYYDVHKEKSGDEWLVITTVVEDPMYLEVPFVNSTHFRRQKDASGWDPQPCTVR